MSSIFFLLQGKAPKEIHAIMTKTLACVLPGRGKDLSAPMYFALPQKTYPVNNKWILKTLYQLLPYKHQYVGHFWFYSNPPRLYVWPTYENNLTLCKLNCVLLPGKCTVENTGTSGSYGKKGVYITQPMNEDTQQ